MSTVIEIKNISYKYEGKDKQTDALENISFDIKKGEFICVLGPSGCGKSTLLNILAGYLFPTSGEILVDGKKVVGPSKERGVVFQSPTLYPWLNVEENIAFGPTILGVDKDKREQITSMLLESVSLTEFRHSKTFELSGGMKQRASLARVLANDPEIILMDEPFSALDALTRLKMQQLIRKIWSESNRTIFMITHDIDEALSLATKIIILTSLPGTVDEVIETSFTHDALKDKKNRVHITEEYVSLKEHILDLIE